MNEILLISVISMACGALTSGLLLWIFKVQKLKEYQVRLEERLLQERQQGGVLQSQAREEIQQVLNPLQKKLSEFEHRVLQSSKEDAVRGARLEEQLRSLTDLNQTMTKEAQNLVRALKGDNKKAGDYGELVLRQLLEASGLKAGINFTEQGEGMGLKDESGRHQKPDVVLHFPEERSLIVDSKVSLKSYEALVNAENAEDRKLAQSAFTRSIRSHIDGLAKKNYQGLFDLDKTPDFVLLFMPIEQSFFYAISPEYDLYNYGWDKKIILVSPTTLLAILKTLESVWRQHDVNLNALKIAEDAGKLYDKFVGFTEDLSKVGRDLGRANSSYDAAMNKLRDGRGNLIDKAEGLKELGARAKKQLQ